MINELVHIKRCGILFATNSTRLPSTFVVLIKFKTLQKTFTTTIYPICVVVVATTRDTRYIYNVLQVVIYLTTLSLLPPTLFGPKMI